MMRQSTRSRRSRPPSRRTAGRALIDRGLHGGLTRPYELLSVQDVDLLVDSAHALLRDTGCVFEPGTEAVELLRAAGCAVGGDGVVRFDPDIVREAIASCAKSARLWDRDANNFIELDTAHTWFMPGMTCIKVYDLASGESRASTADDLAMITRVADALPNIDGACVSVKDVAHSDIHGEINEFATLVHNTTKPLEYLCENSASLPVVIEMAAAVRGSRRALEEKPYFLQTVTPLPLAYWRTHSDQIIAGARAGVPISVGTIPIGGASTPITMAGSIVNSLATDFAAMVLGQLARRGSFVIGSSDVCFMEPATGGIGNFTHASLGDNAMHQVRRHLGIPSFTGFGGQSSARRFNQDAVWEISAGLMQAFYSRPATLDYLGSLDEGMTFSLHALCLCDELAGMLRSMWQGIMVSAETMALDLAHEVGPRGNYLAQSHTVAHCRDQPWRTRYFGPHMPLSAGLRADLDLYARIDEDLRTILATHAPAPLPAATAAALAGIQAEFSARYRP